MPSVRRLALSFVVMCFACSEGADRRAPVHVQSAELAAAGDGGDPDTDGEVDDLDGGIEPCPPFATDTVCNGFDDDCNGAVDEDYLSQSTVCGSGACTAAGATSCVAGVVQDSCTPGTPAADDAICDGVDGDCNGTVDEDYLPHDTSCGVGVCVAAGVTACVAGEVQDDCAPGTPADDCNGLDDDCDGETDETFVPQVTECGVGVCAATGTTSCGAGAIHDSCNPGAPAEDDASCNGLDDDCNGSTDENYLPQGSACGTGACAATGVTSCVAGAVNDSCAPGTPAAHDAICNGVDDDCNGSTDEDFPAQSTACGTGACAAAGVKSCVAGTVLDSCTPGAPAAADTSCNGVDDDCNGATDEDFPPQGTSCGVGACAATGITSCVAGAVHDSCTSGTPAADDASCNGLDDDCNGATDEDYGLVCIDNAVTSCVMGSLAYAPCSDDDACNGAEGCSDGACSEGTPPEPDDGNDCTVDTCLPESGVVHTTAPLGTHCAEHGVCAGSECVIPRSCREWLRLAPASADGVYRVDVDGQGPEAAFDVYCDMTTAGGGWQLITVTQPNRVLVGTGYCQTPSASKACAGQLHPLQASARSEILIRDLENGAWLRYGGFSGSAQSSLRYFTRELGLSLSMSCTTLGHTCDNATIDPSLTVLETSGFPLEHVTPLRHWWRAGGWWVGGDPNASNDAGRVHSSAYSSTLIPVSQHVGLRSRSSLAVAGVSAGTGAQALFHRDNGCADGVQDGDETAIDCGGSCAGCTTGQDCSVHRDCASGACDGGECAGPAQSCGAILLADPVAASGRYLIDVDGPGPTDAFSVYCDMVTDGGGWQLVSSARSDIAQIIFSDGFCTDPSPSLNCHGHIHPLQVSTSTEVMVRAPSGGDYIVYDRFSGGASSALRYFTHELALDASSSCLAPHVCADTSRDPDLRAVRTSGYPMVYSGPLIQWWRRGGWWVSANPNAADVAGRLHHSGYNGSSDLRSRASATANTVLQNAGHQLLLFRTPPSLP
jgi:hypothetical protein